LLPQKCGNCFWSTRDWLKQCPRGLDVPECTYSVTVNDVLSAVESTVRTRSQQTFRLAHAAPCDGVPAQLRAPGAIHATASAFAALRGAEVQHVMQLLKNTLPVALAGQKLALLAPGPADLTRQLRQAGADVVVFTKDLHRHARAAAEGTPGAEPDEPDLRYGNVHHLCTASGSFDIAVLTSQAQPNAHEVFALREALRVVRPGGWLVWSLLIAGRPATVESAGGGPIAYSEERLAVLLKELGVTDVQTPSAEDVATPGRLLRRYGVTTPSRDTLLALVIAKQPTSGSGKGICDRSERDRNMRSTLLPD
jgi:hypothetical protein